MSRDEAEQIIMQARVAAGWISEADLAQPEERSKPNSRPKPKPQTGL